MRRFLVCLAAALLAAPAAGSAAPQAAAQPQSYEAGQVWEYRARPQDLDSLVRIQRVEANPSAYGGRTIYHISLVGLHVGDGAQPIAVGHLPVSRATLDASLTRLAPAGNTIEFPSADEGIDIWREAKGGVFDIPIDQIAAIVSAGMQSQGGESHQPAPVPTT
jgi:hypothetical protein